MYHPCGWYKVLTIGASSKSASSLESILRSRHGSAIPEPSRPEAGGDDEEEDDDDDDEYEKMTMTEERFYSQHHVPSMRMVHGADYRSIRNL
jgi:hypothetical protein